MYTPETTLIASLSSLPSGDGAELAALPSAVRWLEVRADLIGDLDPEWLRCRFGGELVYALRSRAGGGAFDGSPGQRRRRLAAAARRYDMVQLEAVQDLTPGLLGDVAPRHRVVAWHGAAHTLPDLRARWQQLAQTEARLYTLAPAGDDAATALAPLQLMQELRRPDLHAFARGPAGGWTRLLAPLLGAPVLCCAASAADVEVADGALPAACLITDFGLPLRQPLSELYGIAGLAVARSLSPRLHNAAYRALGRPALYLPFQTDQLSALLGALLPGLDGLGMPLRGLTVTSPHKEAALASAGAASPLAHRSGAANTLLRRRRSWWADTADSEGVLAALFARGIALRGRAAVVVGCGGAGRAAAAGLRDAGAAVTLVNRGRERGEFAARLLGLPFAPLAGFRPRHESLVVHATPLAAEIPFALDHLDASAVVVDLVYGAAPTPLVEATRSRGGTAIDGREVLLIEARRQFEMMTGQPVPAGVWNARLLDGEGAAADGAERWGAAAARRAAMT